jgi:hypothetical protein
VRGLTLIQPWAYCKTHLGKRAENRVDWRPALARTAPDVFALHAGLKVDEAALVSLRENGRVIPREALHAGAVVAVATTRGVVTSWADIAAGGYGAEADVIDWYWGGVAIITRDVITLDRPVPAKGALGFWRLPADVRDAVVEQLTSTVVDQIKAAEDRDKLRAKMKR